MTNGHNGASVLSEALTAINGNGDSSYQNGYVPTEQSDDEYIDTIDDYDNYSLHSDSTAAHVHASRTKVRYQLENLQPHPQNNRIVVAQSTMAGAAPSVEVDLRFHNILSQLSVTVERINMDVQQVMARMMAVERTLNEELAKVNKRDEWMMKLIRTNGICLLQSRNGVANRRANRRYPNWWPFQDMSPNWVIFMIIWPFVAHKLMGAMGGGNRGRRRK